MSSLCHVSPGRSCTCGASHCIMAAISRFPLPTLWSSCSVADLGVLYGRNGDSCLFNTPTTQVGDPVCGNGIREGNELCDCGSPQECTDNCCNANTCQLASGAQCSSGPCCTSQCRLKPYGTQCRGATGDCDIAEYCLGNSSECPVDESRVDGTACNSNTGYCIDGQCPTHNAQCMASFSESGRLKDYSKCNLFTAYSSFLICVLIWGWGHFIHCIFTLNILTSYVTTI